MKSKIMNAFLIGLFSFSVVFSVGQLTTPVKANDPHCDGLMCNQPSDCGSKCFCNGPSTTCILD